MIAFLCYMVFFRTQNQKYLLLDVYLTCAAMTRCLSWMRLHLAHSQSRYLHVRLCPFSHEMTPWLRHRAHFGRRNESSLVLEFILVPAGVSA